jgi:hypothetical protein
MAESGDDDQEAALIGAANTGNALFAVEGLGIQIEGIVFDDLFGLIGRD